MLGRRTTVERAIDPKRLRHAARANGPFDAANQNCCRPVRGAHHEIQHLVNAVTQVNIPDTACSVHDVGTAVRPARA